MPTESDAGEGPVAIITGAGSGIGRACARALAVHGHRLALVGRRREALEETAELVEAECFVIAADVGDASACRDVVGGTLEWAGRVDTLVNNAGLAVLAPIDETTPDQFEAMYRINALGPALLIHYAWPAFVLQKSGCIVNVSTVGTRDPFDGFFGYAASKAPMNVMAMSCAREGARLGIRAYAVAPGAVETPMLRDLFSESDIPRASTMTPEHVAGVVVSCVLGDTPAAPGETIWVTGVR